MKTTIVLEWPDSKLVVKVEIDADSDEKLENIIRFLQKAYTEGPAGIVLG